jgi:RHS repeat-associated protein
MGSNNVNASDSIVFDYNDYDKVGNRKSCKIDDADAQVYDYDELYQLTKVDYNDARGVTSYSYDALGNRIDVNENGDVTSYTTNSLNQYTSVGGVTYSYDDNGNLTNDGFYKYYYDCENRLTDVNYAGNNERVAEYKYDWLGRRVRKLIYDGGQVSETIRYWYDGDQVIAEYDGEGTLLRKFIYGAGIDEPVEMYVPGSGWYYYHYDGLGSVVALSDSSGNIVEECSYDVFGEPSCISGVGNPYKFTGRRYDAETGLYYYRERMYSPVLGRFLQPDPIGYEASLNLYAYCANNPINWIDPWGLRKLTPEEQAEYEKEPDSDTEPQKGWYAPGVTPPKNWPDPGEGWKWDERGYYKKGGFRKHWHRPDAKHKNGHWDVEDRKRRKIGRAFKNGFWTSLSYLPDEATARQIQKVCFGVTIGAGGAAIVIGTGGAAAPILAPAL